MKVSVRHDVRGRHTKMDWLEQNIDAYRILVDILTKLRVVLSEGLKRRYGDSWASEGLPSSIFDELVNTKENESAVDWYEDEYQELFNYTTFSQLHEILQNSPELFPCLSELVPTPSLLTARFMELETLRRKVGRARPVGEIELNFVMKFHLHFRKALKKREKRLKGEATEESSPADESLDSEWESSEGESSGESVDPAETPASDEITTATPDKDSLVSEEQSSVSSPRPPQRMAGRAGSGSGLSTDGGFPVEPPEPADAKDAEPTEEEQGDFLQKQNLVSYLENGRSQGILRELFLEVTKLAENLWSADVPETPAVWNVVRSSEWYGKNFGTLGLRALSDFYDVVDRVEERTEKGLARHELQELLEEVHFAQILLNLRDMFQKNGLK